MNAANLPRRADGFRERGLQVTRLETFVDAAFAFSVTLLVIAVGKLPETYAELHTALRRVPTFLVCFAQIAGFWVAHERFSRRFGMEDRMVTFLSLALVAVVLVFVYPLRMIISSGLALVTDGFVPSELALQSYEELQIAFRIFGAVFGSVCLIFVLLNLHALQQAQSLALDARERLETRGVIWRNALRGGNALLSIALSYVVLGSESTWIEALPGFSYALLGVTQPILGRVMVRQRATLGDPNTTEGATR